MIHLLPRELHFSPLILSLASQRLRAPRRGKGTASQDHQHQHPHPARLLHAGTPSCLHPAFPWLLSPLLCPGEIAAMPSFFRSRADNGARISGDNPSHKSRQPRRDPDARQGHAAERSRSTQMRFFSEPHSERKYPGTATIPELFLGAPWGDLGQECGGKKEWGLVTELPGFGIPKALLEAVLPIPPLRARAGAGIHPKHPLSERQKRPLTCIPRGTSPGFKAGALLAPRSRKAGILPIKHQIPGWQARQQFHEY